MEEGKEAPGSGGAQTAGAIDDEAIREVEREMERSISFCLIPPRIVNLAKTDFIIAILKQNGFSVIGPPRTVFLNYKAAQAFTMMVNQIRERNPIQDPSCFDNLETELENPLMFEGPSTWILFYRTDVVQECAALFGLFSDPRVCRPGQLRYMFGTDKYDDGIYVPKSREEINRALPFIQALYEAGERGFERYLKMLDVVAADQTAEATKPEGGATT